MAQFRFVSFVTVACSALALAGGLILAACADDPVTPGPKGDAGATTFDGAGPGVDSSMPVADAADAADAGETAPGGDPVVNDCSVYVDRTDVAASRNIQWDIVVNSLPEHCMKIKVGQTVTLVDGAGVADFNAHPVGTVKEPEKTAGPNVDTATGQLVFTAASPFQVNCQIHPQMKVVILVVP